MTPPDDLLGYVALFLLVNLAVGLVRVIRGPTAADRMMAALLFGSTTVAVLVVLATWMEEPALRIVALAFVLLAAIVTLAFLGTPDQDEA